ncbi:non-specific,5-aminolevulinate synthase [Trichinella spiralis]|uniref:Non-specific,5-aminolevulinate synthase n=1 Tax=Trichinella spiralis TaxID=6334 RepID=A0ABR3KVE8_TRISP
MLDYCVEMGVTLTDHLLTETDQKLYASNTIQNELIHFYSQEIREKIVSSLRRARFFTVIADETKDSSIAVTNWCTNITLQMDCQKKTTF